VHGVIRVDDSVGASACPILFAFPKKKPKLAQCVTGQFGFSVPGCYQPVKQFA